MLALKHLKHNFNDIVAQKLFSKATVSLERYVNQVEQSMREKDKEALVEDFHALKGVLSNIGVKELANLAGELQKTSEKGDLIAISKSKDKLLNPVKRLLTEKAEV